MSTAERLALLTLRLPEHLQQALEQTLQAHGFVVVRPDSPERWEAALERAEIAWLAGDADPRFLDRPSLRWLHCGHAGLDAFLPPALLTSSLTVTSAAGRSAPALAEHALFLMMSLAYDDNGLRQYRGWRRFQAPPPGRRRALFGRTVGIVGMGHTGSALARYASALGMHVLAFRRRDSRTPEGVATLYCADRGEHLGDMLPRCEFLVLACTLNAATHHLIGCDALAALPRGGFLVNIARGGVVDEHALLAALDSGQLAGAALDVFEQEPLPPTHRFWRMPQVVISPHRPPRLADRESRHAAVLAENLRRYLAGEPLLNTLDAADTIAPASRNKRAWHQRLRALPWRLGARLFGPR